MRTGLFLFILLIIPEAGLHAQDPAKFFSDPVLEHGTVSLCILDAKTGETIAELNSSRSLTPASVLKLVTSAAALELLGPEHRFTTSLGYTGEITRSGKLNGDIVILGGGDPAFASENFPDQYKGFPGEWSTAILNMGIRRIEGRIVTDDSYFDYLPVPSAWLWEDAGNYYGAGVYGASVFDNTYEIHLETFSDSSNLRITAISPEECRSELANYLVAAGTTDQGYVYAAPYSSTGWLAGSVPVNRNDFVLKASITDPPALLAKIFDNSLRSAGISISGDPSTARILGKIPERTIVPVTRTESPPLPDIIEVLNHESINLYAEHFVKELGKRFRNEGSTASGIEVIYQFLDSAGIGTRGVFLEDGSGLSPLNAISTRFLSGLLFHMKNNGRYFDSFLRSLPDAGKEGTLKSWFRDEAFGSMRAKSGSMTRVRSYAGYFTARSGREMVFSIIANDFSGPSGNVVNLFEAYLKEVVLNN